ncbi:hypothetical protein J6590_092418 [Homalodisca vitripennis]|nr:hypothetical protein J6590_092418 [Homalodisca vitripennis]
MNSLKQTLQSQSWDEIIQEENTEATYSNPQPENLKKKFVEAQDRYILSGRQEDKADAARKKKDYNLKLRQLRQQANENVIAESSNKSKAVWRVINSESSKKETG